MDILELGLFGAELALGEGVVWLLRALGVACVLCGIGLFLFADVAPFLPAAFVGVGVLAIVVPAVLVFALEALF